tara:strand:- start:32 stop:475 length:444 start_codon:yes stop_codon:yes gene_type:complete
MSTIKVDKLQGTSGSDTAMTFSGANSTFNGVLTVPNTAVVTSQGGAVTSNLATAMNKAWLSGGNDASISNAFNVASGTDNGTGDYSYTLTNSLSSSEIGGAGVATDNTDQNLTIHSPTTSSYRLEVYQQNGSNVDRSNRSVICGDLA